MKNDNYSKNSTIMFPLFLIFLVLKLTHTVDWSWWAVTCPLWIPPFIFISVLIMVGLMYVIKELIQ